MPHDGSIAPFVVSSPFHGLRVVPCKLTLNEVHADFGAAEKMVNGCKQKLLDSINYKSEINESIINSSKLNKNEKNRKLGSHPSWSQRKKYVERGTFDDELIKEIAKTTGCYNTELIKKVREYYKSPIILQ